MAVKRLRRAGAATLAAVAVALSLLLPVPASATMLPPPPVEAIPDLPSRTRQVISGTQMGDEVAIRMWQIWQAMRQAARTPAPVAPPAPAPVPVPPPAPVAPAPAPAPKPITPIKPVVRPGADPLTAFGVGWAIGQGGLMLYAAATDQEYEDVFCGAGTAYTSVSSFITLGIAPDCSVPVSNPNSDIDPDGWYGVYGDVHVLGYEWMRSGGQWYYAPVISAPENSRYMFLGSDGNWYQSSVHSAMNSPVRVGLAASIHAQYFQQPGYALCSSSDTAPVCESPTVGVIEPTQTAENPQRTPRCTIEWTDGTTTVGAGSVYQESTGLPLSAQGLGCQSAWDAKPDEDKFPRNIGVHSDVDGTDMLILDSRVPDHTPEQRRAVDTLIPERGGLTLDRVVNDQARSCMTWDADCRQWWQDTMQGTTPNTGSGTYECRYGGRPVALAECAPYQQTFDTRPDAGTQTQPATITDPDTGEHVEWHNAPSPGNSVDPGVGVGTGGGRCMDEWLSEFNPIDWVLTPVKCALQWAFVPRVEVVQQTMGTAVDAWSQTMPGQLPGIVSGLFDVPTLNGCLGPHVYMPLSLGDTQLVVDWHPLAACDPPMSTVAATSRTIGAAVLIFLTALGIIRRVSKTVNAPGIGGGDGA